MRRSTMGMMGATGAVLLAVTGGCVSAEPKPAISGFNAPNEPSPTRIVVTSYMARDTDSNGFPDLIPLRVHLFEAEGGWPLAVTVPGTFRFELVKPGDAGDAKPLATWEIDPAQFPGMLKQDQIGPCYMIELSLLTQGRTDRLAVESIDLRTTFLPTKASPNPIRGVISMHFGRTR
jgi:hypothetical protein